MQRLALVFVERLEYLLAQPLDRLFGVDRFAEGIALGVAAVSASIDGLWLEYRIRRYLRRYSHRA